MKKVMLMIMILGALIIANAQMEDNNNPFRYKDEWRTEREQAYAEVRQEFLAIACDTAQLQSFIGSYNTTKDVMYLHAINRNCNCSEVNNYAIDLINTSSNEEARKIAIGMLGFRRYYEAIPLLLNQVKRDISPNEKIIIATTLDVLDSKIEALDIFNCNCYAMDHFDNICVDYYFYLFDRQIAQKYFEHFLNKPHTQVEAASYLAKLGVSDKAFPIFAEFLKNNTAYQNETEIALLGLAAIGTEEAFELVNIYSQSKNEMIAKSAQQIYKNYYLERRKQ